MSFEIAKEKAIRYVIVAKKTEYEVINKLKKLSCDDEVIEQVISYLKKLGYIDDKEYMDAYIRQCMRLLNYSIFEIKQKMLQKGINKSIIEKALQNLKDTDYETMLINKLLNGKCKNMEELKQKQYLYRRGFNLSNDIQY